MINTEDATQIEKNKSLTHKKYICLYLDMQSGKKNYIKKLAVLADLFHSYGFDIVITGMKIQKKTLIKLKKDMHIFPIDLTAITSLDKISIILKNSYMLITNDVDIIRKTDASEVPFVTICKTSDPLRWRSLKEIYDRTYLQIKIGDPHEYYSEAEKLIGDICKQSN